MPPGSFGVAKTLPRPHTRKRMDWLSTTQVAMARWVPAPGFDAEQSERRRRAAQPGRAFAQRVVGSPRLPISPRRHHCFGQRTTAATRPRTGDVLLHRTAESGYGVRTVEPQPNDCRDERNRATRRSQRGWPPAGGCPRCARGTRTPKGLLPAVFTSPSEFRSSFSKHVEPASLSSGRGVNHRSAAIETRKWLPSNITSASCERGSNADRGEAA